VIAADNVGEYLIGMGTRVNITGKASAVAPPFERFSMDFNIPYGDHLVAWGLLAQPVVP
jgi:hypothetical protein